MPGALAVAGGLCRRARREPTAGQPGNFASPGPARLARVIAGQGRYREAGQLCRHRACCRTFAAAELVIGRAGPVAGCGSLVAARVTCSGVLRAPGTRPARRERPVPGIPDWPGDMRAVDG